PVARATLRPPRTSTIRLSGTRQATCARSTFTAPKSSAMPSASTIPETESGRLRDRPMQRILLLAALAAPLIAGGLPVGKPEEVGLSSERLRRIHESIQRHIDAGEISGAVTLVAR